MKYYDDCLPHKPKANIVALPTGINMAYYELGDEGKETVVFIHGVTDGWISWAQVAEYVAKKGYYCIMVEYRGNGRTDSPQQGEEGYTAEIIAKDVMALMDYLNIEKAHVVGHSFGSLISQVLARTASERFKSYVLIDTTVDCSKNPVLNSVIEGFEQLKPLESYDDDDYLPEEFIREWTLTNNEDEKFCQATFEHAKEMPAVAWKNLMRGLIRFNSSSYIGEIKGNILVIWGTNDDIFTEEDQNQVKKGLASSNVRYIDIEGASHNGFWDSLDMAKKYAGHIVDFIETNL